MAKPCDDREIGGKVDHEKLCDNLTTQTLARMLKEKILSTTIEALQSKSEIRQMGEIPPAMDVMLAIKNLEEKLEKLNDEISNKKKAKKNRIPLRKRGRPKKTNL
jgi:hypothetical protein